MGFNHGARRTGADALVRVPLYPAEADGSGELPEGDGYFVGVFQGLPVSVTTNPGEDPEVSIVPLVVTLHKPFTGEALDRCVIGPVTQQTSGGFAAALAAGAGEDVVPECVSVPGNTNNHALWRGRLWEVELSAQRRELRKRAPRSVQPVAQPVAQPEPEPARKARR
jgi:hypothetical protein